MQNCLDYVILELSLNLVSLGFGWTEKEVSNQMDGIFLVQMNKKS